MTAFFASGVAAEPARAPCPGALVGVLDGVSRNVSRDSALESVRLGVLISAVGRRSYGPLLLIIGLFSISPATILPGMTSFAALVTLLIAAQMALGFRRPWLPKSVLDIRVPRRMLFEFLDRSRPRIETLDGNWLRERWTFLTVPWFVNLVALCVMAAALITLPLSFVPLAPLAPGIAVVLFGLGMTARDGLWLAIGVVLTAAAFLLAAPMVL
jgi:hypothetical protein